MISRKDIKAELVSIDKKIADLQEERKKLLAFDELYEEFDSRLSATAVERETNRFGDKSGMTIAEYALHALRMKEEWMNTRSLIRVMQEMGFQSQAHNLYTNVFGTLNREVERKDVFTKKGGKWGLREWLDEEESEEMS